MNVFARALLVVALALAPLQNAHALDRVLSSPRIKDNGDIRLSDDVKIGKFQGNKYIATPDALQIQGSGSTGDVSGTSVKAKDTTTPRLFEDVASDVKNALSFGANRNATGLADAAADSTAKLQAYLNAQTALGGTVKLPAGSYRISGPLTVNVPSGVNRFSLEGEGPAATIIYANFAGPAIKWAGGNASDTHIGAASIKRLRLLGPVGFAGSIGIDVYSAAYLTLEDVTILGFDLGLQTTAIEYFVLDRVRLIQNNKGWKHNHTAGTTGLNNVALRDSSITANTLWGAWLEVGSAVNVDNTDIQYNGPGNSIANTSWGLRLTNFAGPNGLGANIGRGTWFEGNGGIADLWVENNLNEALAVHNIDGTMFARLHYTADPESERYTKHNVLLTGTNPARVVSRGSGYASFNTYPASAARPVWANTNTNAASGIFDDGGSNVFTSAIDKPSLVESAPLMSIRQLAVGGLTAPIGGLPFGIKVSDDTQLLIGAGATDSFYGPTISLLGRNLAGSVARSFLLDALLVEAEGLLRAKKGIEIYNSAAPAAPAQGWVMYSDQNDGALKVKAPNGTVKQIAP